MDFFNETDCPAELFRSAFEEDVLHNSLLVRIRYELADNKQLVIASEKNKLTSLRQDIIEDEYGNLEPDIFFSRTGTDLMIFGDAVSDKGKVKNLMVTVTAGDYQLSMMVIGNRIWEKRNSKSQDLTPSEPEPFEKMPMTYKNAFGGKAKTEYGDLPFADNPLGKGYYLTKEEAENKPLPNIENPKALIKQWNEQPEPVGIAPYPSNWGLRLKRIVSVKGDDIELLPENGIFDKAIPALSGKRLESGQIVSIVGMRKSGKVQFQLPVCPFEAVVSLGNKVHIRELVLEEVLIDLRQSTVDLSYRKNFNYDFVPHQIRKTVLRRKRS